jgi:hypothetical protein
MNLFVTFFTCVVLAVFGWYYIGGFNVQYHSLYNFKWQGCSAEEVTHNAPREARGSFVNGVFVIKAQKEAMCSAMGMSGKLNVDSEKNIITLDEVKSYGSFIPVKCTCNYDITYEVKNLPNQNEDFYIISNITRPSIIPIENHYGL